MRVIFKKVGSALASDVKLTGTASQIEWAEQIRPNVDREFDRVARAFQTRVGAQTEQAQAETRIVIAILEEKRAETLANDRAGYFIRDWQELHDQVRQLIAKDPRYQAILADRQARRRSAGSSGTMLPA